MKDTETCVGSSLASYFVLFSLISLVSFYFVFISLISFRFVSFLLISFRFVSFLFRFALYRYPDGRSFKRCMDFMLSQLAENISFFFIEIENFRGEGKILMRHTHDTTFLKKFLIFTKF